MRLIILENSKIPGFLSKYLPIGNIEAITIGPLIISEGKLSQTTKNHESIHVKQYNELLIIGFWIIYYYDYFHGCIKYKKDFSGISPQGLPYTSAADKAYYRIRLEQEAYEYEDHNYYLLTRKKWQWLKKYKI